MYIFERRYVHIHIKNFSTYIKEYAKGIRGIYWYIVIFGTLFYCQ